MSGNETHVQPHRSPPFRPFLPSVRNRAFTLPHGHPWIIAQFPIDLPVADIDGVHMRGSTLEQAVGKPAGGSSNVEAVRPRQHRSENGPALPRASARRGPRISRRRGAPPRHHPPPSCRASPPLSSEQHLTGHNGPLGLLAGARARGSREAGRVAFFPAWRNGRKSC